MEIIKAGNIDKSIKKCKFVCPYCGCEFVASASEFSETYESDGFYSSHYGRCTCPCCVQSCTSDKFFY